MGGVTALMIVVTVYLFRRLEAVQESGHARIEQLYQQRLTAAESVIAAQTASTTAMTAAMLTLNDSLERLRTDLVRRQPGG